MSTRLASGGALLDRARQIAFRWNGVTLKGFEGAAGAEEPNALVGLGRGGRFEPNQRATTQVLFDGLEAQSQNHWPSLAFDVGAINARLAPLFPAGFYYKTFINPRIAWKHLFEPIIRQSAGLGRAPKAPDADVYEYFYAFVDVLIVGGGVAGLTAALAAGQTGAKVLLIEQTPHLGGRALVDEIDIDGQRSADWVQEAQAALRAMPNVTIRTSCMGAGVYDHGYVLANEEVSHSGLRQRLWRIRAKQIVTTTVPGVMLASAVRDYLGLYGVSCGDRTVLVTNNDDGYRTAIALKRAGLDVPVIADARGAAGAHRHRDRRGSWSQKGHCGLALRAGGRGGRA